MLDALGLAERLPVARFYDEREPIYEHDLPPELFLGEVPVEWLEERLRTNAQRLNRGFWALNRTLLRRHGLRVIGVKRGKKWYRRIVPTLDSIDLFRQYVESLPKEDAERLVRNLITSLETAEEIAEQQAQRVTDWSQIPSGLRYHLLQLASLHRIRIRDVDVQRRTASFRESQEEEDPEDNVAADTSTTR